MVGFGPLYDKVFYNFNPSTDKFATVLKGIKICSHGQNTFDTGTI